MSTQEGAFGLSQQQTIILLLCVLGFILFILFLAVLPDDAYGEEDVRVFSEETIRARKRTQILVLGDIGRSPRMQYHALSLAKLGVAVDLIGYVDSDLHPAIKSSKNIKVHAIPKTWKWLQPQSSSMFIFAGPLKAMFQFLALWNILGHQTKPAKYLIVQNPPSIPTLFTAVLLGWLRKTRVVIDWHNFGYSMLALRLGGSHPLVRVARWYEAFFARIANINITVTKAMAKKLKRDFGLTAPILTLHDRPSPDFEPFDVSARLDFLKNFPETSAEFAAIRDGHTKVLVSSTSWTADEDFSLLLAALIEYSTLATSSQPRLPSLLVIITGKGPQRDHYSRLIVEHTTAGKLARITIKTAWLALADYAALLAAADLGVSLHTSSSGVDLPMKVVDMFGAGLPVAAWSDFEAWPELGIEGVNSRGFRNSEGLREVLVELFGEGDELARLKEGVKAESKRGWADEWNGVVGKALGFT